MVLKCLVVVVQQLDGFVHKHIERVGVDGLGALGQAQFAGSDALEHGTGPVVRRIAGVQCELERHLDGTKVAVGCAVEVLDPRLDLVEVA